MHPSTSLNWHATQRQVAESGYTGELPSAPFWFGGDRKMCDNLSDLVLKGTKTATASLLWEWRHDNDPIPSAGQRDALLDWDNRFIGILETTHIVTVPFAAVTLEFARLEGEGDLTLAYWREVHWRFFDMVCDRLGREMTEQAPVVCQEFRLVYRNNSPGD